MEPLIAAVLDGLERGEPSEQALLRIGAPEPERTARALLSAARHPDLAPTRRAWGAALLGTARPGFGARALEDLATRYRSTRHRALDPVRAPTLPRLLGCSDFLTRILLRHPDWADSLDGSPPPPPETGPGTVEPDWTAIRIAKYRGLLRIVARDLFDRPFEQSLRELSDLADSCLEAALRRAAEGTEVPPPALLALGKLGGRELNLASDVDLMFVYDAPAGEDDLSRNQAVCRIVRELKTHLESRSEDGFGYRVDLDLRPEGRTGTLANSVDAALGYYEAFGAEWERQMLIRCRWVAGPRQPADVFQREISPFVYRSLIDPSAIHATREMKARIEAERRSEGRDLEMNLKEGPGGIRDVEFLVQSLQLYHGHALPTLRSGTVLDVLGALADAEILPADVVGTLSAAYVWLRRAEHALQMVEERQTHTMPRDPAALAGLARRMGYRDEAGEDARNRLMDDWVRMRTHAREHFQALVLRSDEGS